MNFSLSSQLLCISFAAAKTITFVQFISRRSWYMSCSMHQGKKSEHRRIIIIKVAAKKHRNRDPKQKIKSLGRFCSWLSHHVWWWWWSEAAQKRLTVYGFRLRRVRWRDSDSQNWINQRLTEHKHIASESEGGRERDPLKNMSLKCPFRALRGGLERETGDRKKKGNQQQIINERIA